MAPALPYDLMSTPVTPDPAPPGHVPPPMNPPPPIDEPEPDRLPDERPYPNPDEDDEPAKTV